jgi:ribosomal-protein-alanine N-acetyltransferase
MTSLPPGGWTLATPGPDTAVALAALHALCFTPLPETPWSADALAAVLRLPTTIAFAALDAEGEAAGFLAGRLAGGEAEILTLCVAPDARRNGVARGLLDAFFVRIGAGVQVSLEVAAGNAPARALYRSAGFRAAGRRPGYYANGGQSVDAIVMVRSRENNGGQTNATV